MKFSSTRCRNEVAFMGVLLQVALSKAVFPKDMFGPPLPSTEDEIMQQANRKVGTCVSNVQADLRWGIESTVSTQWGCNFKNLTRSQQTSSAGVDWQTANQFISATVASSSSNAPMKFFDSSSGKLLFVAPRGRSMKQFLDASKQKSFWLSFTELEIVKDHVRKLPTGEIVSVDGMRLGHYIQNAGYLVDLANVAGRNGDEIPVDDDDSTAVGPPAIAGSMDASCPHSLAVYFGNGCFWHTQYDFYEVETDRTGPFKRRFDTVTGRVGYAGGKGTGPSGQVCYHGGPSGTEYENMAYAEAVQVMLDLGEEIVQFNALAKKYFEDTFHNVNGVWTRGDPGDSGAPYRNVIGIPGGVNGPLYSILVKHNIHSMPLIEGGDGGNNDPSKDTKDQGVIYVYDTEAYPFYRGEQYHMFHANVVLGRDVPKEYLLNAAKAAAERGWTAPTCRETKGDRVSNIEVLDTLCGLPINSVDGPGSFRKHYMRGSIKIMLVVVALAVVSVAFMYLSGRWTSSPRGGRTSSLEMAYTVSNDANSYSSVDGADDVHDGNGDDDDVALIDSAA